MTHRHDQNLQHPAGRTAAIISHFPPGADQATRRRSAADEKAHTPEQGAMRTMRVHGTVQPGFERVAEEFTLNFTDRGDRGAACTIIVEGATVVDLWGGEARDGVAWRERTKAPVFSVSKAVTAVIVLMASEQGFIDLDAPVSRYWPEFGAHGKDRITVRRALAHRAGVPTFTRTLQQQDVEQWSPVVDDLAAQVPLWEPGAEYLYHPISVGFIAGELLRRTTGRLPSQWLADINDTLNVRISYGADVDDPDLARVFPPAGPPAASPLPPEFAELAQRAVLADGSYAPDLFTAANTAGFLSPLSPAANVVATARDLATFFAAVGSGPDSTRLLKDETITAASRRISYGRPFAGEDTGQVWGTGLMVHSASRGMAGTGSIGHDGAGGQLVFSHPGRSIGFAYQTNQPLNGQDVRMEALSAALRESL